METFAEPPVYAPRFEHGCPLCTYLGFAEHEGRGFDLYYCSQGHELPTLIARASDNPHDYTSGMALAAVDPVLREALERAKRRGLVALDYNVEDADG